MASSVQLSEKVLCNLIKFGYSENVQLYKDEVDQVAKTVVADLKAQFPPISFEKDPVDDLITIFFKDRSLYLEAVAYTIADDTSLFEEFIDRIMGKLNPIFQFCSRQHSIAKLTEKALEVAKDSSTGPDIRASNVVTAQVALAEGPDLVSEKLCCSTKMHSSARKAQEVAKLLAYVASICNQVGHAPWYLFNRCTIL